MTIIAAVAMKTESGDDYLSLFTDISSPEDFVERVEEEMSEELAYVWDVSVVTDCMAHSQLEQALYERIKQMQEE